jgi:hypothetical protein
MKNIHEIMDEIGDLELELNSQSKLFRSQVIQTLINRGLTLDEVITEAPKLCHFIEHGTKINTAKPAEIPFASVKPVQKRRGRPPIKGKRKYTKRSKFWKRT